MSNPAGPRMTDAINPGRFAAYLPIAVLMTVGPLGGRVFVIAAALIVTNDDAASSASIRQLTLLLVSLR